jgi:hypothetical protein
LPWAIFPIKDYKNPIKLGPEIFKVFGEWKNSGVLLAIFSGLWLEREVGRVRGGVFEDGYDEI